MLTLENMINKVRRRSMNATPTRPSNKSQWQGANKNRTAQGRARAVKSLKSYIRRIGRQLDTFYALSIV
jgi:hypothetical protein